MFSKLTKNIRLPLLLTVIIFALVVDVVSVALYSATLKSAVADIGEKRTARTVDSCRLYVNSAMNSTYKLSQDSEFISDIANNNPVPPTEKLQDLCHYSLNINAATVYTANGLTYSSSGVTQLPTLEELRQVAEIAEFLDGDKTQTVSLRTKAIAGVYENHTYDPEMGVVTCCQKVFYDGDVVAWLFTDILPETLYKNYVYSENKFGDVVASISFADGAFRYENNLEKLQNLNKNRYFCYTASADGLFELTVFESKAQYDQKMALFGSVVLAATAVAVVLTLLFSTLTAKSVTARLSGLAEKMNQQKLD